MYGLLSSKLYKLPAPSPLNSNLEEPAPEQWGFPKIRYRNSPFYFCILASVLLTCDEIFVGSQNLFRSFSICRQHCRLAINGIGGDEYVDTPASAVTFDFVYSIASRGHIPRCKRQNHSAVFCLLFPVELPRFPRPFSLILLFFGQMISGLSAFYKCWPLLNCKFVLFFHYTLFFFVSVVRT